MNAMVKNVGLVLICLFGMSDFASAQIKGNVTVTIYNQSNVPVLIQGASNIGGMVRRGPALVIPVGKVASDFNVPAGGVRFFSAFDANQSSRNLMRDLPIQMPAGGEATLFLRQSPTGVLVLHR